MSDAKQTTIRSILGTAATHFFALVVGVLGGWLTYYVTLERPQLRYEVISSAPFSGETQRVAIVAVKIYNDGKKEAEDVVLRITFPDSTIKDIGVSGLPENSFTQAGTATWFEITIPFFNATETLTTQLLIATTTNAAPAPLVELRGKGSKGIERSASPNPSETMEYSELVMGLLTALTIFYTLLLTIVARRSVKANAMLWKYQSEPFCKRS